MTNLKIPTYTYFPGVFGNTFIYPTFMLHSLLGVSVQSTSIVHRVGDFRLTTSKRSIVHSYNRQLTAERIPETDWLHCCHGPAARHNVTVLFKKNA